jgi:hypothetical protein
MHRKLAFDGFPKLIPDTSTWCCAPTEETASEDAELAQRYVATWIGIIERSFVQGRAPWQSGLTRQNPFHPVKTIRQ